MYNGLNFLAGVLLLPCALAQSSADGPPQEVRIHSGPYRAPSATISVQTNLVDIAVTVRDRKGTPLDGFHASDFQIFDNGKPQTVTFFSEQRTDSPATPTQTGANGETPAVQPPAAQRRYLALFFDDTHSAMAGFERSKHAAEKLISSGLRAGDRVGIFTGSGAVTLEFTGDAKTLLATVASLKRHPEPHIARGVGPCPTLSIYQAYVIAKHIDPAAKQIAVNEILACQPGTPYWVAVLQAQSSAEIAWEMLRHEPALVLDVVTLVARHLAAQPGARILLMVSPGFVSDGLDRQTATLVDICLRNGIVLNALDDEGLVSGGSDSPESLGDVEGPRTEWSNRSLSQRNLIVQQFLSDTAAATGGEFIHNNNDLNRSLQTLATAPQFSYLLGFSPSDPADNKYHKLRVTLAKPADRQVSARPGYFSTPAEKTPETAQQRIDRVAASTELLAEIPATVNVQAVGDKLQVDIAIDAKGLTFTGRNGASVQQLTFVTILQDARGNYLDGKQAVMDMDLSAETRADLETKGIKAATSFAVPKGSYRVREVIREAVQNHLWASTTAIEIH